MTDVFSENNAARGVSDRAQRIAFWVSLTGLVVNTVLFSLYVANDSLTTFLVVNYTYYTLTISMIAWSAYRNWHFSPVLSVGIAAIYFHMWGTTFFDAWAGQASILSFPTLLFVPLCMILISGPRVLLLYAAVQTAFVYAYMNFLRRRCLRFRSGTCRHDQYRCVAGGDVRNHSLRIGNCQLFAA